MTGSLSVVALGAVAAAAGTGVLAARCARTPRLFLVAWTVAVFALAVALGGQAVGYLSGFTNLIFRAVEIGAQAVAPLALCLGLVELVGRSIVSRFAMRLAVSAIGVIVLVVLYSDPLSPNITLSTSWPDPAAVYQLVPVGLIKFLAGFTMLTALGAVLVAGVRSSRGSEYVAVVRPALAGAGAAIMVALPGAAMLAGSSLGALGSALAQVAGAALASYGGVAGSRAELAGRRRRSGRDLQDRYDENDEDWPRPLDRLVAGYGEHRYDDSADPDYGDDHYRDDYGHDRYRGDSYRDGYGGPDAGMGNPALAALAADPYEAGDGFRDSGSSEPDRLDSVAYDRRGFDPDIYTGAIDAYGDVARTGPAGRESRNGRHGRDGPGAPPAGPLFGQITIYTVLDERIEDFDRMSERVVEQVRANEPGTLVYIAHAVPTAPMQRILYEVYKDRAAYDDHLRQPYVARFTAERRALVLAANSIELGLQQAKVSPLPSFSAISDMLSESGIDLTGVTEAGRRGEPGTGSRPSYGRPGPRELPPSGYRYRDEPGDDSWPPRDDGRYR